MDASKAQVFSTYKVEIVRRVIDRYAGIVEWSLVHLPFYMSLPRWIPFRMQVLLVQLMGEIDSLSQFWLGAPGL